jgi:hypothetical protein
VWLSNRALAYHAQDPGFDHQHRKREREREREKERERKRKKEGRKEGRKEWREDLKSLHCLLAYFSLSSSSLLLCT